MKISVAIPCWSMNGVGREMLEYNFNMLKKQTFTDFEVVVTDHSEDNNLQDLCYSWKDLLTINYIRNEYNRGSPADNTNLGIKNSKGDFIKLLCQDDFLFNENSLEIIYNNMITSDKDWMFTAYYHSNNRQTFYNRYVPYLNSQIHTVNTLGTPSALTIKNRNIPEIDNNLKYMYDCEFYYRLLKEKGAPHIVDEITMVNYLHENQTTNSIINHDISSRESEYIRRKHC